MTPLVSVVLPVRNGGSFLGAAVDSILTQSLADFELLVVDDHGSDGALQALPGNDQRLRIMGCRGRGVVDAFNTGLEQSRGRFIARMDADDVALPDRLALQVAYLQQHVDIGIAGGCVDFFAADGVGQGNIAYRDWLNSLRRPEDIRRAIFIESPIPNPTAMFRREVLERLGGYRDTDWPEDYDLYLRANEVGIGMGKPGEIVLLWRDHPGRLTRSDPRYSRARFQRAKAHFLARRALSGWEVLIWGAGPTGKQLHDLLALEGVSVDGFVEVHPRRIGGHKRGKPVFDLARAARADTFVLVAVGARDARRKIRAYLDRHGRAEGRDYLFMA